MRMGRTFSALALAAALLPAAGATDAAAQDGASVGAYRGAAALGLALRRVGTTKRVLMVGAHPDDEYTPLLARLALEEGADVAYLSLTRGEGGQNGIGPELGEGLGLLRTEELLAARRVDGARQFFSRAYDFGFSKSADEAFRHWPREELLRDAVWVIRRFRPDVVVTVFSGTPRDGHGQHQASAIIGREAFFAAGDPARFPEQLGGGVTAWRPAKLYMTPWGGPEGATVRVEVGAYDPLVGRSPYQLAMASRSLHRSQDMGRPEAAGPRWAHLTRVFPEGGGTEASIWEGVDTTLLFPPPRVLPRRLHPLERARSAYGAAVAEVRAKGNPLAPAAVVAPLARLVRTLPAGLALGANTAMGGAAEFAFRAEGERRDAEAALALAQGVVLDAVASDARIVLGQELTLDLSLWNGGEIAVAVDSLAPVLPAGWTAVRADSSAAAEVAPGALLTRRFRVRVAPDAAPTEPYFLRAPRDGDLYRWPAEAREAHTLPFEAPPVRAAARVRVAEAPVSLEAEATFREVDPRQGELRRPVMVVPAVSVRMDPPVSILPSSERRPLRFRVRVSSQEPGTVDGALRIAVPAGWRAEPAEVAMRLAEGEEREVEVTVHPAGGAGDSVAVEAAFVAADGRRFSRGVEMIDYPHVRARPLFHRSASAVRVFEVGVPAGLKVAYVEGAGEPGPAMLEQLGITPDLLDAHALASADLSGYDVIIAGSRAYEVRADLAAHNARLLEYVRGGGTLIVQYNKYELVEGKFTPYPLTMARPHDRVTDEAAPVRILEPAHPVLTTPNRITADDFSGWVQERGLYFARTWDDAYTPLLETGDLGEALRGGLLVAKYGQGTYVYTGLAFFRQLPEGVPGAWRLFANLLALGKD
jgi:LmbE family N-acetylglucosaminyl deacetylase